MRIAKTIIVVIAVCLMINSYSAFAQSDTKFSYPLKVPMSLSGNYGELRSNHFHGGIDFRIGGVSGAPVYAAGSGYISRISVSGTGYGNALYITHPNGFVSVYGHLQKFAPEIAEYVRREQYKNRSFVSDIRPDKNLFPVKRGDFIANAGNTGSSGGPHLHFEIRDTNNVPLNIFSRGYIECKDNTRPEIRSVKFFRIDSERSYLRSRVDYDGNVQILGMPKAFYVAVDAIDRIDGSNAKFAVDCYEVYFDNELVFRYNVGEVPFEYGRYINSLIEYSEKIGNRQTMVKSYCEPGNILLDRVVSKNNGIVVLNDSLVHTVKVVVSDFSGNRSSKSFRVKHDSSCDIDYSIADNGSESADYGGNRGADFDGVSGFSGVENNLAYWYIANLRSACGIDVIIPSGALYDNAVVAVDTLPYRVTEFSPHFSVGRSNIPLQLPYSVKIKCSIPDSLQSKAMLGFTSMRSSGMSGVSGEYVDGYLYADLYSFGNFTVAVDTVPPVIKSSIANNAKMKGSVITFKIKDDLSGIKRFTVEIDGEWVLAKWDSKTAQLSVNLNECGIKPGNHTVVVKVSDNKSNESVLKRNFRN